MGYCIHRPTSHHKYVYSIECTAFLSAITGSECVAVAGIYSIPPANMCIVAQMCAFPSSAPPSRLVGGEGCRSVHSWLAQRRPAVNTIVRGVHRQAPSSASHSPLNGVECIRYINGVVYQRVVLEYVLCRGHIYVKEQQNRTTVATTLAIDCASCAPPLYSGAARCADQQVCWRRCANDSTRIS